MPERDVVKELLKQTKALNGVAYKQHPTTSVGLEDWLVLLPIKDKRHKSIVNRYVKFVECKAADKSPRKRQEIEHERKRKLGYDVTIYRGEGVLW